MRELEERIVKDGKVLPGNIIKIDGFLNHRVDCALMGRMADAFAKYYDIDNVDIVLTAEASGIALAAICALKWGKKMLYAKKAKATISRAVFTPVRSIPIPIKRKSRRSWQRTGSRAGTES